jgi:protein-tyrosine phosphatase
VITVPPGSVRQATRVAFAAVFEAFWAWFWWYLGFWPLGLGLAWVSAVTAIGAFAIWKGRPGLLGKRSEGTFPWWSYVVFWPWHLNTQLMARVHRRTHPPPMTEILPGLWLGGWPAPGDVPDGAVIVDLTAELPRRVGGRYRNVPAWDATAPSVDDVDAAARFVAEARAEGVPVLVHCAHGRGRSALVLCAALVVSGEQPDVDAAWAFVAGKRLVRMSGVQRATLQAWGATYAGRV